MDPNERLSGIAALPQGGPSMGPPPMPQPGMGGPPPMPQPGMGGPPPGMGGGEPPMDPMMGGGEPPMNVEQDAMMLAEAVVGRTQGDVQSAIDVLDTAKAMLMSSGGSQEPQMMNMGGPLYKEGGGYVDYKMGGGPLYAAEGRTLSDSDVMRQMIMEDLNQGQSGRTMSDEDIANMLSTMGIESGALGSATNPSVMDDLNTAAAKERLKDFVLDTNPLTQKGRKISRDTNPLTQQGRKISRMEELRNLFRKDKEMFKEYTQNNPTFSEYMEIITRGGESLNDEDAQMLYEMGINSGPLGGPTNPDIKDYKPNQKSPFFDTGITPEERIMDQFSAYPGEGGRLLSDEQRESIKEYLMNLSTTYRSNKEKSEKMPPVSRADGGPFISDAQKYREAISAANMN